jgi:hypothetical protein
VLFAPAALAQDNCAFAPEICGGGGRGALPQWIVYAAFFGCVISLFVVTGATRWLAVLGVVVFGLFSSLLSGLIEFKYFSYGFIAVMGLGLIFILTSRRFFGEEDE